MHGWYQTLNISIHNMKDNIQIPPYGLTINIGAEADFIKIFVLNSHKDKGGKKTASRTTRLPRLFVSIRSTPYCKSQNNVVPLHGGIIFLILRQEYAI